MIEYFDLDSIYLDKAKQKILKRVVNSRGASSQKVLQLINPNENIDINSEKQVLKYCTKKLQQNNYLYSRIESLSQQYLSGSMAYVFKAKVSGIDKWIAIKILREDIEKKIERELSTSSFLTKNLHGLFNSQKFNQLESFSSQFIKELIFECNLIDEAKNYRTFKRIIQGLNFIKVPDVYDDFTSKEILCSEWIEPTIKSDKYRNIKEEIKEEITGELKYVFITQALQKGIIQEDSNPANFIVSQDKLYFIDFGKLFRIPLNLRISLCYLLYKINTAEKIDYLYHYELLGYDRKVLETLRDFLPAITEIMFAPFINNYLLMSSWDPSEKLKSLLGESVWLLRSAGSYSNFRLTRSLLGFFKVLHHLDVNISCKNEIEVLLEEYSEDFKILDTRNTKPRLEYNSTLDNRKIEITINKEKGKRTKVVLPIRALYSLKEFISEEIYTSIKASNLDISTIIESGIKGIDGDIILDTTVKKTSFKIKVLS